MQINWIPVALCALIPTLVGFIWYGKMLFGNIWMKESGIPMEKMQGMNFPKIMIFAVLLGGLASVAMLPVVLHQMGVFSLLQGVPGGEDIAKNFVKDYATNFRTFKHGAFHGVLTGIFLGFPITAMAALWERRSFKYVAIGTGYWIVCLALIGGVICQWA